MNERQENINIHDIDTATPSIIHYLNSDKMVYFERVVNFPATVVYMRKTAQVETSLRCRIAKKIDQVDSPRSPDREPSSGPCWWLQWRGKLLNEKSAFSLSSLQSCTEVAACILTLHEFVAA